MKRLLASLIAFAGVSAVSGIAQQAPVAYRLDEVRRTVTVTHGSSAQRAGKGQQAASGDKVETGWFSYALIGSERHRAQFEIFSSTSVTLASDTPGVILTLERGRIRAAFDKITGSEPRTVQTPGALLAVRGTQFDVEVDRSGNTTLDVFEGVVEVQSSLQREPLMVRAGEESIFGPRTPPVMHAMPEHRRRNGPEGDGGRDRDRGKNQPPNRGDDRRAQPGAHGDRPPGDTGHGQAGPPSGSNPPPPPPRKPPVSYFERVPAVIPSVSRGTWVGVRHHAHASGPVPPDHPGPSTHARDDSVVNLASTRVISPQRRSSFIVHPRPNDPPFPPSLSTRSVAPPLT